MEIETPDHDLEPVGEALPRAIICDLDGTLADLGGRHPFDFENVDQDSVKHATAELVRVMHAAGFKIILISGRDEVSRRKTIAWLAANEIPWDELAMRKSGDFRKDAFVKREIYRNRIRDKYEVLFVLEDRDQVVEMWRKKLNLPCFRVDYGNF